MRRAEKWWIAVALTAGMGAVEAGDCPAYPEWAKTEVYRIMNARLIIRDTYIGQEDCKLNLAIVGYITDEATARKQGDSMVRLTKSMGPEPDPGQQIGRGTYDYLVGIFRPDGTTVEMGAKARSGNRIVW